ncbi:MAG: HepT-like ribonuclease domain-containing protein [Deltaproteobacteria bacterium]
MREAAIEVLKFNLENLKSSVRWLRRSQEFCLEIGIKGIYSEEEFDDFENLTSRFARTTDLIVNKVLRSIDSVEFLEAGSAIDAANRAEKRGIIDSVSRLRDLKDLRNEIAHEYETDDLGNLFSAVLSAVPELLGVAGRIGEYCERYY